ncbi:MAG: hypothetical protein WAP23_02410 [Candidatus Spechtbacterales bacterium]
MTDEEMREADAFAQNFPADVVADYEEQVALEEAEEAAEIAGHILVVRLDHMFP